PLYVASGLFLGGTAAMIVLVIGFQERGLLTGVTQHHHYELARMLCAASAVWVFIWFSQYMLIYYTNIPEEAAYYARQFTGSGRLLFLLNPALTALIPLVALIPVRTQRSPRWLLRISAVVLIGRWLDLYLLIMPALGWQSETTGRPPPGAVLPLAQPPRIGVAEIGIFLVFLPLFLLPVVDSFRRAEALPRRDPYLVESASLHV